MNDAEILNNSQKSAVHTPFYERYWKHEDKWPGNTSYGLVRIDFMRFVLERYVGKKDLKILDLGCGTGWMAAFLHEYGAVHGIDFAAETISKAQAIYGSFGDFYVADVNSSTLGLQPNAYDLIVASEVIEHVENHQAFIEAIKLLLRPGGWLILTTPNKALFNYYKSDIRSKWIQPIENWISTTGLKNLIERNSFQVAEHIGFVDGKRFDYTITSRVFGNRWLWKFMKQWRLQHLYGRLVLRFGIYQLMLAKQR